MPPHIHADIVMTVLLNSRTSTLIDGLSFVYISDGHLYHEISNVPSSSYEVV